MDNLGFLETAFPPFFYARNGRWLAAVVSLAFWPWSVFVMLYNKCRYKDRNLFTGAAIGEVCPFCRYELNEGSTVCAHCHATRRVSGLIIYWALFALGLLLLMVRVRYLNTNPLGIGDVLFLLFIFAAIGSPFLVSRKVVWRRIERL